MRCERTKASPRKVPLNDKDDKRQSTLTIGLAQHGSLPLEKKTANSLPTGASQQAARAKSFVLAGATSRHLSA